MGKGGYNTEGPKKKDKTERNKTSEIKQADLMGRIKRYADAQTIPRKKKKRTMTRSKKPGY